MKDHVTIKGLLPYLPLKGDTVLLSGEMGFHLKVMDEKFMEYLVFIEKVGLVNPLRRK